jgi:multidrug efflux system membrane fusion protein
MSSFSLARRCPLLLAPLLLACLLLALGTTGCSKEKGDKPGQKKRSAIPVAVATSGTKTLSVEIAATGHVEAAATVEIRSQVTGTLKTVHFKEGDEVKGGELLFTIDPRPFAAGLAKAEADLAKDRAELENARREVGRYVLAAQKGYVSQEQADQAATRVATLTAMVKADEAVVENARLDLEYCSIRAPFSSRAGEILTDQGNLIKANADSPMVTLNRVQPILATFTVPGQHLQAIFQYRAKGSLTVFAVEQATGQQPLTGTLVFIDNTVDPTTGVIRLKANFANEDRRLWPGQLIDVRLHLFDRAGCVVVPSQAVQAGQQGTYVYVVKEDQTVAYRSVRSGMLYEGETVIEEGLAAGERVVIDGQMQLADGVKIEERGRGGEKKGQETPAEGKQGKS